MERTMKTVEYSRRAHAKDVDQGRVDRSFDAVDSKGRQFGARVRKFSCEYERVTAQLWDSPGNGDHLPQYETGRPFYGFRPHATRDGVGYGASQSDRVFSTEAERDAAVDKYFATAERGALKNKNRAR